MIPATSPDTQNHAAADDALAGSAAGKDCCLLLGLLDPNLLLHILSLLPVQEVCVLACTCRLLLDLASQPDLWKRLWVRECPPSLRPLLLTNQTEASSRAGLEAGQEGNRKPSEAQKAAAGQEPNAAEWKGLVLRAIELRELRSVKWERVKQSKVGPTPREGHAAQSWGNDGMIMFGGWGGGIHNDTWVLKPGPEGKLSWSSPVIAGRRPAIRYGHSATRCGKNGDMLFVYGGMQRGGYSGEIRAAAVLRPVQAPPPPPPPPAAGEAADPQPAPGSGTGAEPACYEWFHPSLHGDDPEPRGYHAACASEDGSRVYLFGGIAQRDCCSTLAIVDLDTWQVSVPRTTGIPPTSRFGCSLAVHRNQLWVVGGGCGHDLGRSGYDHADCYCLDLATLEWQSVDVPPGSLGHDPRFLGRCHASCRVGSKLLLFGGSLELGNEVSWLDLEGGVWGRPRLLAGGAQPPAKRMSAVMALAGRRLLVFGGWIYCQGEMGDLYSLQLGAEPAGPAARGGGEAEGHEEAGAAAGAAAGPSSGGCGRRLRLRAWHDALDEGGGSDDVEEEGEGAAAGGEGSSGGHARGSTYLHLVREHEMNLMQALLRGHNQPEGQDASEEEDDDEDEEEEDTTEGGEGEEEGGQEGEEDEGKEGEEGDELLEVAWQEGHGLDVASRGA